MQKTLQYILLAMSCVFVLTSFTGVFANGKYSFGPPELPPDVPKPIALHVRTDPPLPVDEVLGRSKDKIYRAKVGTTIQLRVEAEYKDGSRRDVTQTLYTFYHSTDAGSTLLKQTGEISFIRPEKLPFPSLKEKKLDTALITIAYGRNIIAEVGVNIVP